MLEPAKSNDEIKPLPSFYKIAPFLSHRAPSPAIHFLSGENVSLRSHFLHQENVFYCESRHLAGEKNIFLEEKM